MDLRPVLYIIGIFLCTLAGFMAIPMFVDLYHFNDDWMAFASSIGLSVFCGVLLILSNKQKDIQINGHQAFVLTATSWFGLSFFSAFPFILALPDMSFTNAYFEAVSGLTTTGATVLSGLDNMPAGILLWRALLHWLGGAGIIVMAISVLPFLKIGGMQLFRLESSEKEKTLPRARQLAAYIILVHTGLTIACSIGYFLVGMTWFDAIAHSMATVTTGGFSTHDTSFGGYDTYGPELIAIIFMVLGSLPLVLYIKMATGNTRALIDDQQAMGFLKTALLLSLITMIYLIVITDSISINLMIEAIFTTISFLSGTGFVDTNYMMWGGFAVGFFLFISCIGGCAGSATCGIKIFRFQILAAVTYNQILQLIHPNGVFTIDYNKQPLSVQIAASVMAFFFVFTTSCLIVTCILLLAGQDIVTSFSCAIATLANVGAGLGNIVGPTGNFAPLPDNVKWILIVSMMLGRLEFFTLLVFFVPRFWRS